MCPEIGRTTNEMMEWEREGGGRDRLHGRCKIRNKI